MIITYPDQITHKAIIDTLVNLFQSTAATGAFSMPKINITPGDTLDVKLEVGELHNSYLNELTILFKKTVEKNMAF